MAANNFLKFAGKRIMSGIQPTAGAPHIGNYFGALANWKGLAAAATRREDVIFSIVDLHALTSLSQREPGTDLRQSSRDMAAAVMGCGVDPGRCVLYRQSHVQQHTELTWILNCLATPGQMERMTQYKDKIQNNRSAINMGLYSYPILQTADILLYRADLVPVGNDQWQHLELCRDLAQRLNNAMGCGPGSGDEAAEEEPFFTPPQTLTLETNARVRSLQNGRSKMSKSAPSDMSRINLTDSPDVVVKKLRKATTDAEPLLTLDPENRPEIANLLGLYAAFAGMLGQVQPDGSPLDAEVICSRYGENQTGKFKSDLAEVAAEALRPIAAEISRLQADPAYIDSVLDEGADKARAIAEETMKEVKKRIRL